MVSLSILEEVKSDINKLTSSSTEDENLKREGSDLTEDSQSSKKPRNDDGKSDNSGSSGSCSPSGSSSTPPSCSDGGSETSNNRNFLDHDSQILLLNIIIKIVAGLTGGDDFEE
uniref:Uncharacterized protein n=1 Tax=Ophiocordyceps sinensis TaxID=72228 RepID=A0A1X8VJJ6_9HYPO|nr:hypothetical protein [Ophiocordyceps sinensis]ARF03365.1 hypothetical protein [Ophiocordyceps sinensis]